MKVDGVTQGDRRVRLVAAVVDRQDDRRRQEADADVRVPRLIVRRRHAGAAWYLLVPILMWFRRRPRRTRPRRPLGGLRVAPRRGARGRRRRAACAASSTSTTPNSGTCTPCGARARRPLYLFDVVRRRRGPTGEVVRWSTWCLVRGERPLAPVAFRATARREASSNRSRRAASGASARRPGAFAGGRRRARGVRARRRRRARGADAVGHHGARAARRRGPGRRRHGRRAPRDRPRRRRGGRRSRRALLGLVSDLLFLCTLLPIASPATVDPDDFLRPGESGRPSVRPAAAAPPVRCAPCPEPPYPKPTRSSTCGKTCSTTASSAWSTTWAATPASSRRRASPTARAPRASARTRG